MSSDFLELRRLQRLHSNVVTPAVSLRAADGAGRCFRRLQTVQEEGGESLMSRSCSIVYRRIHGKKMYIMMRYDHMMYDL